MRAAFHVSDIGVVHGEAVAVFAHGNDIARARLDEEIHPRTGIEAFWALNSGMKSL